MADSLDLHIDSNEEGLAEEENSTVNVATDGSEESEHPWPYLSSIFRYKGRQDNSVKLVCLLCSSTRKSLHLLHHLQT